MEEEQNHHPQLEKQPQHHFLRGVWYVIRALVPPVLLVLFLHFYIFQAFRVVGTSMLPTLHNGDYLVVSKAQASWARLIHPSSPDAYIPSRDQIVVFHYPLDPKYIFVKRVIGLPGERVVIKNGTVTIYNSTHPNGFNPDTAHATTDPVTLGDIDETVPAGDIFVLGDNRTPNGSADSREWGFLPSHDIIGVAELRLLPLDQAKILSMLSVPLDSVVNPLQLFV